MTKKYSPLHSCEASNIALSGVPVEGNLVLLQSGQQLMGLRSYFGLAPIPPIGVYQFGGVANLSFLKPAAGREALSRKSIEQVTRLVSPGGMGCFIRHS